MNTWLTAQFSPISTSWEEEGYVELPALSTLCRSRVAQYVSIKTLLTLLWFDPYEPFKTFDVTLTTLVLQYYDFVIFFILFFYLANTSHLNINL